MAFPFCAARVEDLARGDIVVVECGACGHATVLPPASLRDGLQLAPHERILDLAPRLRCRSCDTRGRAAVSVKWRDARALP